MTITREDELDGVKSIGRIVASTLRDMARAMEPGMTTRELDDIGRALMEAEGATPAPEAVYAFPGATCISVNEEIAHGIPGSRILAAGDLVNIDVSASKGGYFADTGASFVLWAGREGRARDNGRPPLDRLCRDGRRALDIGLRQVVPGRPLSAIGKAVGRFAQDRGYTLIRNLASHGVGRSLHEYPEEIATWPVRDRRPITRGLVLTVEPFLSKGGLLAREGADGWTLYSAPAAAAVQYEHTVVATDRGPLVVTRPA